MALPTGKEAIILAWVIVLIVLSLPAVISIIYCRNQTKEEKEFRKWIAEDLTTT